MFAEPFRAVKLVGHSYDAKTRQRADAAAQMKKYFFSFSHLQGESEYGKLWAFLTAKGLSDSMSRPRKLGITKVGLEVEGSKNG